MGISFNKTMRDLEIKSSGVSKSMGDLVNKANKLASVKDSLIAVPKQLKMIQDSMSDTPEIDVKSVDQLNKMLDAVKNNINDVDFEDLKGKIGKLSSSADVEGLAKKIQKKLNSIEVTSAIEGGAEAAKESVNAISAEINKLGSLRPGDALITEFLNNLKELKKDSSLSDVLSKHQQEISDFEKAIASPSITYKEVADNIIGLNGKISESMKEFFETFDKDASDLASQMSSIKKEQESLSDSFREGYKLTFHTEEAVAEFQGVLADLTAKAYMIQARNIIPDDQLMKTKELQDGLRTLNKLNDRNKILSDMISSGEAERKGTLEKVKRVQELVNKKMREQVKHMRQLEKDSSEYADNMIKGSEAGFGEDKANDLGNKLTRISGSLGKMGSDMGENSKMGKGLKGLSGLAGRFGGKLKALSFPIAIVTYAVAATKALMKMESQFHAMNKEALNTGALANVTGDVSTAYKDLNLKLNNTKGLMKAAMGGQEFGLAREDIIGMTNSLRDGGVAIYNLKKGMDGVKTTAEGVSNEYLNAAAMVTTFSTELGVAPGLIAQSIGEMTYDYNENLGSIRDTYTEIATASKNSGMSQTRFLASVQTATAGLSIYESQIGAVAKIIAGLGKEENITGKAATDLAKNMSEFANDSDKVVIAFSKMGLSQKDAMRDAVAADIARIKSKKKLTKEDKNQLAISEKWLEKAGAKGTKGDWGVDQAAGVKSLGSSAQTEVYATAFDTLIDASNGSRYAMEKMATGFGLSPEAVAAAIKSTGGDPKKIVETLRQKAKEALKQQGDADKMTGDALEKFNKTSDPRNKALDSIWKSILAYAGAAIPLLTAIAAGVGGFGALKGITGMMGGGSKGIPSIVQGVGKMGVGDVGSKIGSVAKNLGQGVFSVAKKAGPLLAAFTAAASSMYNVYDMFSTGPVKWAKELDKKFNDRSVLENLMHPIDSITAGLNKWVSSWDWLNNAGSISDEDAFAQGAAMFEENKRKRNAALAKPSGGAPLGVPIPSLPPTPGGSFAVRSPVNLANSRSAGGTTVNNQSSNTTGAMTNIINVNGGDLNEVKKVIINTIEEHSRQRK